jgi:hypothetical protein
MAAGWAKFFTATLNSGARPIRSLYPLKSSPMAKNATPEVAVPISVNDLFATEGMQA